MLSARMLLMVLALLAVALPTAAQESASVYVAPTPTNLVRAMLRLGLLQLNEPRLADDYARLTECQLLQSVYADEFRLEKFRAAIRQVVARDLATFPQAIQLPATLRLDRYDFSQNIFRFQQADILQNVSAFALAEIDPNFCFITTPALSNKSAPANVPWALPLSYRLLTEQGLTVQGISMPPEDAKALADRLRAGQNTNRVVQVLFKFQLIGGANFVVAQRPIKGQERYTFDARLNSIEFYEDEARTQLITVIYP